MGKRTKTDLITSLIRIKAVQINSDHLFTWSSGIKSPIYVDNRIIGSFVVTRNQIYTALAKLVTTHFAHAQAILGVATGGIIPATFVARQIKLPLGYVRNTTKDHGRKKTIEGFIPPQTRIVLIEDTLSTGRSLLRAYQWAVKNQLIVLGAVTIFSYNLVIAQQRLATSLKPNLFSLLTINDLLTFYQNQPVLQAKIQTFLKKLNQHQ